MMNTMMLDTIIVDTLINDEHDVIDDDVYNDGTGTVLHNLVLLRTSVPVGYSSD